MKKQALFFLVFITFFFQGIGQKFDSKSAHFDTSFYDNYKMHTATLSYKLENKKHLTDKKYNTLSIYIETFKEKEQQIIQELNSAPNIKNLILEDETSIFETCKINNIKLRALKYIRFLEIKISDFEKISPIFQEIAEMPRIEYLKLYPWAYKSTHLPQNLLSKLKGICIGQNYIIPSMPNNLENLSVRRQFAQEVEQTLTNIDKNKIKYLEIKTDTLTSKAITQIGKFTKLKSLLLDVRKISPFMQSFQDLKKLKYLYIQGVTLSNKDFNNLKKIKKLTNLRISLDSLQAQDCSPIWEISKLKKVKIYTYDTISLLWKNAKYRNIEVLDLNSFLKLHKIDDDLSNFMKLKKLYIGYNKLKSLPKNFGNLRNLEILDISNNQITALPKTIGKLKKLKQLKANRNEIKEIPNTIKNCKKLEFIDLSRNLIQEIPIGLCNLPNLKKLRLNGNKLTKILKEIGQLRNLQELYLGSIFKEQNSNNISSLPIEIQQLKHLRELDLSKNSNLGNNILPILLKMPNKWSNLSLSNCGITKLPKLGWKNSTIEYLDLSCNTITEVPKELLFSNIKSISLSNNPLGYLNASMRNDELKIYAYLNDYISKEDLLKEPNIAKATFKIIDKCYIGDNENPILKLYPILQVTDTLLARKATEQDIYAISLCKAKRYKESIPFFNRSIEIDLSDHITWFNSTLRLFYYRHIALLKTGDTISAIKDLKYITNELNKDFSARIFEYAYLTNDTQTAKEYLPKALAYYKNKKEIQPIEKLGYLELLLILGKNKEFNDYSSQLKFSKTENKNCYFIHKYLKILNDYDIPNFVKNATELINEMQTSNYKGSQWNCQLVSKWAKDKKHKAIIKRLNSFIQP